MANNKKKYDNHHHLGKMGEDIVKELLKSQGHTITDTNWFDNEKDFLLDNTLKCEVKTQVPWLMENSFTFRENQIKKILNADKVYFISVPVQGKEDNLAGKIFVAESPKDLKIIKKFSVRNKRDMFLVERGQLKQIASLTKEQNDSLFNYATSMWKY